MQTGNIKIRNAVKFGAYIVNEQWLQDFIGNGIKPAESGYFIGAQQVLAFL